MEYPWQQHHPPPPLHPPPPPPPLPPGNPANLCPTCSFSHFPFCPFPQQFHNPSFHQLHNRTPIFHQSHNQTPTFDQSHYGTPDFQLDSQRPNFQSHDQNPSFQLHDHTPNFHQSHNQIPNFDQSHYRSPNFKLHNQSPDLQLHDHNPSFQLHDHNPSFQLHDKNPSFQLHDQSPDFQLHNQRPNLQSHDRSPNFRSHDRSPNFRSHDQNPSIQLHDRSPSFRSHDQNPSIQLHDHIPNFLSHDQNPGFQLHDHNPNFQFHNQRPSFLSHDQNPGFQLHDHNPNFQNHNQRPNFPSHDPSFRSRDQNPRFQPFEQSPGFRLQDQSPSFRSPANYSQQNPQMEQIRNSGADYSPFDHGYKRPRNGELGVDDDERRLKLIRDHGVKHSNLVHGEIREHFHGDSGLKRPRFDESGVGKKYSASNLNTHYEIDAENELSRRGYGEEPSLQTNFRDNYEQRQARDDIYPKSYGVRSNIPPTHDTRSRVHSNESAFLNHVSPTSLQVSPQNRTSFENTNVGIARGINGPASLLKDPNGQLFPDQLTPSSQSKTSSLFPISVAASAPIASSYDPFSEAQNTVQPYFQDKSHIQGSNGLHAKEFQPASQRLSVNYQREGQRFPLIPSNKPKAVDASHIFKQPHRASRPDRIVVILRGLPGSGKSYLAKIMRDLEVDNGGNAPRIHSMDDYFMTEVEKVEESDNSKSSGSSRGKKPLVKMVMEYCYEAEMEEAYRSSMLKTFKKTLDEGAFPFVIVDDRNLRVADFAQFWATAKRSGYEVYLLEPTYKDPAGCAARNVHGFTLDDIQKMAYQWEEAPSMYLKLEAKSLLQGDDSKENAIQEVDMDTGDGESEDALNGLAEGNTDISASSTKNLSPSGPSKAEDSWNVESDHLREEVKELGRSKWSNDLEDDDGEKTEANKGIPNALSAMVKAYKREGKSVHWGDKAADTGFSIGAAKRVNTSLEIGPGSGYNSKSNPLPEDVVALRNNGKLKTQSVFQERIRAERESFRAVFDRRRHRIGGLGSDEE